jgi:DNA (cytosine-5)-methyltransferase 1
MNNEVATADSPAVPTDEDVYTDNKTTTSRQITMPPTKLRLMDLCCGTGGFSIAARKHFKPVWANDKDLDSKVIYEANHPGVIVDCRPLNEVPINELPKPGTIDVITGGFPCQPYSIAGQKRGLLDPRADVFEHILKVTKHLQPRWLVCENVANLVRLDKGKAFAAIQAKAQQYLPGWSCRWTLYNTVTHTGVPQNRERVYIVWFREKADAARFEFTVPEDAPQAHVSSLLIPCATVADKYYYNEKPGNVAASMMRACVQPVHTTGVVYQRRPDLSVRQNMSGVVPALTANMGQGCYSGPVIRDTRGVRKFTPGECFAAQGFPRTYKDGGLCDTTLYRLVGNAVSVPVAELVLDAVYQSAKTKSRSSKPA